MHSEPSQRFQQLESIVAVSAFPIVFCACLAYAYIAMERGVPPLEAIGLPTLAGLISVAILERIFPLYRSWLHSTGDLRVDLAHVLSITATSQVANALAALAAVGIASTVGDALSLGLWPTAWPVFAQLALALALAEFPKYWHHRLQHETDLLWRFHATHHSCPRLYFLNATRFHPIDIAIDGVLGLTPLLLLGCSIEAIALFSLTSAVHGYFQHANLKIRLGPLNYVFSMAELHRWHHSQQLREANNNYGQNLILWDLVFGTFFWPRERQPPEHIGIPELPAFPMGFWRQLASPFQWRQIKEESRALREAQSESAPG